MALHCTITRHGTPRELVWTELHAAAMIVAAGLDSKTCEAHAIFTSIFGEREAIELTPGLAYGIAALPVIAVTPLGSGAHTITTGRAFKLNRNGDAEYFAIEPGDVLEMYI